ncbi:MAG: undecaprenyl-diphosphatase UppP [Anaerolineales bacterium]
MTPFYAFLLGIIQGLTEFIPVSSTAHLLITQTLLGLPADDAMFSFLVIVQLGTLVSLFIFYWQDLLRITAAVLRYLGGVIRSRRVARPDVETALGLYIILATLPALAAGYLLRDAVEALFRQPLLQASIRLFAAALLLTAAERFGSRRRSLADMTWQDALVIGVFQVISVFPGASRSGTTISGGMLRGLDRPAAARFAFLMSVPIMLAAGAFELLSVLKMPSLGVFLPSLTIGFVTAAVVGWLAIRWLIGYLGRHSLYAFAAYCAVLGLGMFIVYWM